MFLECCIMESNKENLFMHRFQGAIPGNKSMPGGSGVLARLDLRPSSPITYWKSPYAQDRQSIFNNQGTVTGYMQPHIKVTPSKFQHKLPTRESRSAVKGILKSTDKSETAIKNEDHTPRISHRKPNLITTGTGSGRPHGVSDRSQSATGKHVKFEGLPKPFSANNVGVWSASNGSFRPSRKLTANRNFVPIRQLGSGLINYRAPRNYPTALTLSGGESHIKGQIEEFVKKLRMVESARLAKEAVPENDKDSQRLTAGKLRKTRSDSVTRYFHDWKEFDLDNNPVSLNGNTEAINRPGDVNINPTETRIGGGQDDLSHRDSLSSTTLDIEDETSTSRPSRPKPNASLNTKYRHITTNDVNLHKYDDIYQTVILGRDVQRPGSVTGDNNGRRLSFCDPQKASDIMGWLVDVENANGRTPLDTT